uniref:26S proteasome non-ATPase regulatory subunit 6 n=1 Tax=Brunneria borealis TaxID=1603012 RepID=A0A481SYX2_9NEOP|nr:26S proteasome non-ATPase regulatory subunit [Brunneria borealis]
MADEHKTPLYVYVCKWKFQLEALKPSNNEELKKKLLDGIVKGNMAPYYRSVCDDFGWEMDTALLAAMQEENNKVVAAFDVSSDADVEVQQQAWLEKLEYLISIGDKDAALKLAEEKAKDKQFSINSRLEAVFNTFRVHYLYGCNVKEMKNTIEKTTEMIGDGGDWSSRNRLKAYEAVCNMGLRNYSHAAYLLLDAVSTFESYELMDYDSLIWYTVLSCMIALPRKELKEKMAKHGTLMQALNANFPELYEYYDSLYKCHYADFFKFLASLEGVMKLDPLLHPHYHHYINEMRYRAYSQHLQAYRSISLQKMASSFGVTSQFIEEEISQLTAAGRLHCKIDAVNAAILSYYNGDISESSCEKGLLYQNIIKRGDYLLNRLNKLARVIDF